jgi:hypothetical protein
MGRDSPSGDDGILDTTEGLRSKCRFDMRLEERGEYDRRCHALDSASPTSCAEFASPEVSAVANAVTASAELTNCVSARSH